MSSTQFPHEATVLLQGLVGSKAYGLDTPTSDEDVKGIFAVPTEDLLALGTVEDTITTTDPDYQAYELRKFCKLAASSNPTILELLYLQDYSILTPDGADLINIRDAFPSNVARKTYGGYALQQAKRLQGRAENGDPSFSSDTKKRTEKHARHCFRLLMQGSELLRTGRIRVRVTTEEREKLFALAEMSVDRIIEEFEKEFEKFNAVESVLPDRPNMRKINEFLVSYRINRLDEI